MHKFIPLLVCASALGACGGTTIETTTIVTGPSTPTVASLPGPITQDAGGGFSFTDNGTDFVIPPLTATFNGLPTILDATNRVSSYQSATAVALGGISGGETFAVVNGTATNFALSDLTYTGRYSVLTDTGYRNAAIDLEVNGTTAQVSGATADLAVFGSLANGNLSGTVTYDGATGSLEGLLSSETEIAGAFAGNDFAGVIYGTR